MKQISSVYEGVADPSTIKWDRELERRYSSGALRNLQASNLTQATYRPFVTRWLIYDPLLISVAFQTDSLRPFLLDDEQEVPVIAFHGMQSTQPFASLAIDAPFDICLLKTGNGSSLGVRRYRYTASGERVDNITDWGLKQFQKHYGKAENITKDDVFHYVYGVLHDPIYREKYALNLKREFPRIPFYPSFRTWADWGERLMGLHIGYESVDPWPLTRTDTPDEKSRAAGVAPKTLLRADRDSGVIHLDTETTLSDIPKEAWDYRLGNRSGLDWILDQYKEKAPRDPTICEKFNAYRFADYKEKVVDLLMRVTRVSVETMEIVEAMREAKRVGREHDAEIDVDGALQ